jgi:hypothetical protein
MIYVNTSMQNILSIKNTGEGNLQLANKTSVCYTHMRPRCTPLAFMYSFIQEACLASSATC